MTRCLAIDSGGTKTIALLAELDQSASGQPRLHRLGRGYAAGCNRQGALDCQPISEAIAAAFDQANCAMRPVAAATFALAGAGDAPVARQVQQWVAAHRIALHYQIVPDVVPMLAAAPQDRTAIALISGTGAMAWGRQQQAPAARWRSGPSDSIQLPWKEPAGARAGGLGPLVGDQGSGYWIGVRALRAVARQWDLDDQPTELTQAICAWLKIDRLRELPSAVAGRDAAQLAELAPIIIQAWSRNDPTANQILLQAARHLSDLVLAVLRKLKTDDLNYLAMAGGVLVNCPPLQRAVLSRLREAGIVAETIQLVDDPVELVLTATVDRFNRLSM